MPALGDGRADGVWCTLGEPRTTAQIAQNGFAWLGLDAQHGAFDDATLLATMPALAAVAPQVPSPSGSPRARTQRSAVRSTSAPTS